MNPKLAVVVGVVVEVGTLTPVTNRCFGIHAAGVLHNVLLQRCLALECRWCQ